MFVVQSKLAILASLVILISLVGSAYAHKGQVVGDYKIEVGWDKEPPIAGMDNKITIMITHASAEEKAAAEKADHDKMKHGDEEMSHDKEEHMDEEMSQEMSHEDEEGISGLASKMDVTVTLGGKKTALTMVEDEEMPGFYFGELTPQSSGFPTVHLFVEIDDEPIEIDMHPEKVEEGAVIETMTSDGSINVDIITTAPAEDEDMLIRVEFTDTQGNPIEHVNYDIIATQEGTNILSEEDVHTHSGETEYHTDTLRSDDPVDIQVKILGIGLPDDETNWSGPMGETISVNVVPEFGSTAMIVLAATTISIVMERSKIIARH